MPARQFAGLLRMLARAALGRGAGRVAGTRPLDWGALPLPALDGGGLDPALFAGHAVLVVNTASRCGFTSQYGGLQRLWQRYRPAGLVVLGIPSNDFARQEPGDAQAIRRFCDDRFAVDFPLLAKQAVLGPQAYPLYRWAQGEAGAAALPAWNFHKLLIGRDGRLVGWFAPAVGPGSGRLRRAIEAALA